MNKKNVLPNKWRKHFWRGTFLVLIVVIASVSFHIWTISKANHLAQKTILATGGDVELEQWGFEYRYGDDVAKKRVWPWLFNNIYDLLPIPEEIVRATVVLEHKELAVEVLDRISTLNQLKALNIVLKTKSSSQHTKIMQRCHKIEELTLVDFRSQTSDSFYVLAACSSLRELRVLTLEGVRFNGKSANCLEQNLLLSDINIEVDTFDGSSLKVFGQLPALETLIVFAEPSESSVSCEDVFSLGQSSTLKHVALIGCLDIDISDPYECGENFCKKYPHIYDVVIE